MSDIEAKLKLDVSKFAAGIKSATNAMDSTKRRVNALRLGIAGMFSVFLGNGLVEKFKAALDMGGELSDLSARTGATAGEMLVLKQAMQNAGMSGEAVGDGVARLQKALAGVNEDGQSTVDVFGKLGLNVLALGKMSVNEQFAALSAAFQRIEDPARRAQLAMALFGRSGAALLPLLRDTAAFTTAETQVGGLAGVMDEAAVKFDTLSDSIGALGLKTDQFFAAFANAITNGTGVAETLDEIDFTAWGEAAGEAASAIMGALNAVSSAIISLLPVFAGFVAQIVAVRLNAVASGGAFTRIFSSSIPAAIGQARVQTALFGMEMRTARGGMAAFRTVAVTSLRSVGAAIKGLALAFGPVGLAIMAATEAIAWFQGSMQKAVDTAKEMRRLTSGFAKDIGRNAKNISSVSGEEDRTNVAADLDQQLESVREAIANVDEDFAHLGEAGIEEARWRLEIQQRLLEKQKDTLANLSPAIIAANAAEKERVRLLAEAGKEAENLAKELERALEASDKAAEKRALAAMTPSDAEAALLGKAGAANRESFSGEMASLRGMSGSATDDQKRRLLELLAINEQLLEVDGRREDESRKIAEAQAKAAADFADLELASRSMSAQASGNMAGAAELDRQLRAQQMARGLVERGMESNEATALSNAQTRLADMSGAHAPQLSAWASSSRQSGLGGNAATNAEAIQRLQAERQREANGLLREIKDLLKRQPAIASGEMVFS